VSADKGGPRDWDKELAEIDKLIESGPKAPAQVPAKKGAAPAPSRPSASSGSAPAPGGRLANFRYSTTMTWVRLVLATLVGVGMTQWPYTHGCGMELYGYLAAVGGVIVASFWSLVSSWKSRSSLAHGLSIVLLFWGSALAAREILPRIGYAKTAATWECPAR
jgi:hypothetical protein